MAKAEIKETDIRFARRFQLQQQPQYKSAPDRKILHRKTTYRIIIWGKALSDNLFTDM